MVWNLKPSLHFSRRIIKGRLGGKFSKIAIREVIYSIGSTLLRLDSFRRAFMWIFLHFCQVKTIYELFVKSKLEKKNYVMLRQKWKKKMPTDSRTKNVRLRNMSAYFIKTHMFTIFCLSLAETIDTQKPSFSLQRACTLCQKF